MLSNYFHSVKWIIFQGRTQFLINAVECGVVFVFRLFSLFCNFAFGKTTTRYCCVSHQRPQASVRQLAHWTGGDGPVFGSVLCGPKPVPSALEAQLQEGLQRRGQQNIPGRPTSSLLETPRGPQGARAWMEDGEGGLPTDNCIIWTVVPPQKYLKWMTGILDDAVTYTCTQ